MIETTPNTPDGPATSALTLGRNRVHHAAGELSLGVAALTLVAYPFVVAGMWSWWGLVALGIVATLTAQCVIEFGAALLALRTLRRCSDCRAAAVARAEVEARLAARHRAHRHGRGER